MHEITTTDLDVDKQIDLRELWNVLWSQKLTIVIITLFFALSSMAYALLATEWYRAEALLAPADEAAITTFDGGLGGLAALAGVSVGSGNVIEAIATLKSRAFAREFIIDYDLLPVFFHDEWDPVGNRWVPDDSDDWPDVRNGVTYFQDNILRVYEDRNTGLVSIGIDWIDPNVAAEWAEAIIERLNSKRRERALREAEANIGYLQEQLSKTNVVSLQQSVSRLLESELQKLMLARGNEEFAFRTIDSPVPPKERLWPKRSLICVMGTLLGGVLSIFVVFLINSLRPANAVDEVR